MKGDAIKIVLLKEFIILTIIVTIKKTYIYTLKSLGTKFRKIHSGGWV
jgi:hypothetical protein